MKTGHSAAEERESRETSAETVGIRWRSVFGFRSAGVIYALVVLLAALTLFSWLDGRPFYLNPINVANLMEQTALLGIIAVGMALLLISGSFDLSVGSLAALAGIVTALGVNTFGLVPGILCGLVTGAVGGFVNGSLHWYVGLNPFVVTLGTLSAFRGLTLVVSGGRTAIIEDPVQEEVLRAWLAGHWQAPNSILLAGVIAILAANMVGYFRGDRGIRNFGSALGIALVIVSFFVDYRLRLSYSTVFWLAITIIVWMGLSFTAYGHRLRATGADLQAARRAGVRVAFYKIVPFVIVGLFAGFAGSLITARLGAVDPNVFTAAELTVIASAVVGGVSLFGGTGSVVKAACGALLLFTINNGLNMLNVSSNYQLLVAGSVIIASAALYVLAERRGGRGGGW